MAEPRYRQATDDELALVPMVCEDCGLHVVDTAAHARFHSILSAHAWALAVLQTAHINAATHGRFDTYPKIKSRKFDSWSADALAEVMREMPPEDEEAEQ